MSPRPRGAGQRASAPGDVGGRARGLLAVLPLGLHLERWRHVGTERERKRDREPESERASKRVRACVRERASERERDGGTSRHILGQEYSAIRCEATAIYLSPPDFWVSRIALEDKTLASHLMAEHSCPKMCLEVPPSLSLSRSPPPSLFPSLCPSLCLPLSLPPSLSLLHTHTLPRFAPHFSVLLPQDVPRGTRGRVFY